MAVFFFICDAVLLTKALNPNDEIRALNGVGKETFFLFHIHLQLAVSSRICLHVSR